jgi:hypothetical protein
MVSIGSAVFYRPKDKAVHAENAHRAFSRGNVGDHIQLLHVYQVRPAAASCSALARVLLTLLVSSVRAHANRCWCLRDSGEH